MSSGVIRTDLPLTAERARQLVDYDPGNDGPLTWRVGGRGHRKGKRAGARCGPYRQIMLDGTNYREHRVIWLWMTGKWPEKLIDHKDGNGLNNAWENLREATHQQNAFNKRPSSRNTSGIVGVSPAGDKWQADIGINGRIIHLGQFECKADAAAERCRAERHYFGDFASQARRYPVDAVE